MYAYWMTLGRGQRRWQRSRRRWKVQIKAPPVGQSSDPETQVVTGERACI